MSSDGSLPPAKLENEACQEATDHEPNDRRRANDCIVKDGLVFAPTKFRFKNRCRCRIANERETSVPSSKAEAGCQSDTVTVVYLQFVRIDLLDMSLGIIALLLLEDLFTFFSLMLSIRLAQRLSHGLLTRSLSPLCLRF